MTGSLVGENGCSASRSVARVRQAVDHAIAHKVKADPKKLYDADQLRNHGTREKPGGLDQLQDDANKIYMEEFASNMEETQAPLDPFANWLEGQTNPSGSGGIRLLQLGRSSWNDDNYSFWREKVLKYWKGELIRQAVVVDKKIYKIDKAKHSRLQEAKRLKLIEADCVDYIRETSKRVKDGLERPFDAVIINVSYKFQMPEGTVTKEFLQGLHDVLIPGGVLSWKISLWCRNGTTEHYRPILNLSKQAGFQWTVIDPVYRKTTNPKSGYQWVTTSSGWPPRLMRNNHSDAYFVAWKGMDEADAYDPAVVFEHDPAPYVIPSRTPSPSPPSAIEIEQANYEKGVEERMKARLLNIGKDGCKTQ